MTSLFFTKNVLFFVTATSVQTRCLGIHQKKVKKEFHWPWNFAATRISQHRHQVSGVYYFHGLSLSFVRLVSGGQHSSSLASIFYIFGR